MEGKDEEKGIAELDAVPKKDSPAQDAAVPLRSNFSETAFWQPHLLTGSDGTASVEFTVPDSVTGWRVFVHAVTQDLMGGSLQKEARTVKDLMVRPYLPRFFREGDTAELRVMVNNAGETSLSGAVSLEIVDPITNALVCAQAVGRSATGWPRGAIADALVDPALRQGAGALAAKDRNRLLADPAALSTLHWVVWTSPHAHASWRALIASVAARPRSLLGREDAAAPAVAAPSVVVSDIASG